MTQAPLVLGEAPMGPRHTSLALFTSFFFLLAVQYHLWDLIALIKDGTGAWQSVLSPHHWTVSIFLHFIHFSKQPKDIGISQVKKWRFP